MISTELGHVSELVRYPVKSMAGIAMESATLGWHGVAGDRRFAFRRLSADGDFPWLTASRVTELLLYHPVGLDGRSDEPLPTHVQTPAGNTLELRGTELASEIAGLLGSAVELMHLRQGIFDDATISAISLATIAGISAVVGADLDRRRFRANILLETTRREVFLEDGWVGGIMEFGARGEGPAVHVTARDVRCMMINLDPDTAAQDARALKAVVQLNGNNAGVYGTVVRTGNIRTGDAVRLVAGERG